MAPTVAAPVAAAPAAATADRPAGIFVPKWVGIVAAAIVAALVFGGIGYAIGDSSSDSDSTQNASAVPRHRERRPALPNGGQLPGNGNGPFGNGNGNSNGNGNDNSQRQRQRQRPDHEQRRVPRRRRAGQPTNGVEVTEVAERQPRRRRRAEVRAT